MIAPKRLIIFSLLIVGLTGCTQVKEKLADIKICWHNDACRKQAVAKADDAGNKADQLAGLSGIPWASKVARPAVSYVSLFIALCSLGSALRKKEIAP